VPLTLTRHAWTGARWTPCPSLDAHGRAVLARWPDAEVEHVAGGTVHRLDGQIVAEARRRDGWPIYEEWTMPPTSNIPRRPEDLPRAADLPTPERRADPPDPGHRTTRPVTVTTTVLVDGYELELTIATEARKVREIQQ
jgi:hypothetical protein